jgi:hypothetical protein
MNSRLGGIQIFGEPLNGYEMRYAAQKILKLKKICPIRLLKHKNLVRKGGENRI